MESARERASLFTHELIEHQKSNERTQPTREILDANNECI